MNHKKELLRGPWVVVSWLDVKSQAFKLLALLPVVVCVPPVQLRVYAWVHHFLPLTPHKACDLRQSRRGSESHRQSSV